MEIDTDKTNLQNIFLLGIFALLLVAVIAIFKPFFTVILWSSLLYILISPFYRKIINKMNPSKKGYKTKIHILLSKVNKKYIIIFTTKNTLSLIIK